MIRNIFKFISKATLDLNLVSFKHFESQKYVAVKIVEGRRFLKAQRSRTSRKRA